MEIKKGGTIVRVGHRKKNGFLMAPRLLTNFEEQKYYQSEPRFNGVYSKDNLTKIKNRAYVINLDEYSDIGLHCMYWIIMLVIFIVLKLKIFQKKLKHSSEIKA